MTDNPPTPSATPLWAPASVPQPAYSPQPQGYGPAQPVPYGPPPIYGPPQQPVYGPPQQPVYGPPPVYGPAPVYAPYAYPQQIPVAPRQSPLPVDPMRYHQFLHTPRRRWWKAVLALLVAGVTWLLGSILATVPAIIYDIFDQKIDIADTIALQDYLGSFGTHITPAVFLANNVGIIGMIPCAWLGLIIYGQRPKWLSSIVGGMRWRWMFRLMGLMLIPYLGLQFIEFLGGSYSGASWRPYSLFMILAVLLTTPLQCAGEEYGVRGLVNRVLGSYGSPRISFWIAAVGSSLVFMALHVASDLYLNVFYFSFGMVACWMAWRTGGLEASIAMHVINNVLAEAVLPFTDFSGMFDRSAGTASAVQMIPLAFVMAACVGIVEWQARRVKPVAVAAPGAVYNGLGIPAG